MEQRIVATESSSDFTANAAAVAAQSSSMAVSRNSNEVDSLRTSINSQQHAQHANLDDEDDRDLLIEVPTAAAKQQQQQQQADDAQLAHLPKNWSAHQIGDSKEDEGGGSSRPRIPSVSSFGTLGAHDNNNNTNSSATATTTTTMPLPSSQQQHQHQQQQPSQQRELRQRFTQLMALAIDGNENADADELDPITTIFSTSASPAQLHDPTLATTTAQSTTTATPTDSLLGAATNSDNLHTRTSPFSTEATPPPQQLSTGQLQLHDVILTQPHQQQQQQQTAPLGGTLSAKAKAERSMGGVSSLSSSLCVANTDVGEVIPSLLYFGSEKSVRQHLSQPLVFSEQTSTASSGGEKANLFLARGIRCLLCVAEELETPEEGALERAGEEGEKEQGVATRKEPDTAALVRLVSLPPPSEHEGDDLPPEFHTARMTQLVKRFLAGQRQEEHHQQQQHHHTVLRVHFKLPDNPAPLPPGQSNNEDSFARCSFGSTSVLLQHNLLAAAAVVNDVLTFASTPDASSITIAGARCLDQSNEMNERQAQHQPPPPPPPPRRGNAVMIYCREGKSRSASVAAAYLICYRDYTYRDAMRAVKMARGAADPKLPYCYALEALAVQQQQLREQQQQQV